MAEVDKAFVGSIPEIYATYLVPLIFEGYAADLAERVAALRPSAVLEIAAGTGVVARALAPRLSAEAHYVVTDLNQPMLDRARAQQPADKRVTWRQADATNLPFADASFDVVCCQFGVMFFPDRVGAYRETRRVLKPGGHFVFNVWDRIEESPFAQLVTAAGIEVFPQDPPLFMARTPHGYHDTARIRVDLEAAGFTGIGIETLTKTSRAPSPRHAAIAIAQGTPMRTEIENRNASLMQKVTDRAAELIAAAYGSGAVSAPIGAHVVIAKRSA
jgi:ubiquinone/menaquinone biosynthesis C-methylase UbiE